VFITWLIILVGLIALLIYDAKWFLLPNRIVYPLTVIAVLRLGIVAIWNHDVSSQLLGALSGIILISGTFLVLYHISKGSWIGGGDVKLGVLLGILVGGPLNSILLLVISSSVGTVYALPMVVSGKASRKTQVPFGPFLIIGAIVVTLFGTSITHWYRHLYI
jgi:leader peptidase (prepilin peptidase)/N-methyltransferase